MYTFIKYKQYLKILKDGSRIALMSISTHGKEDKGTYLELTDGESIYISIRPDEVSGCTTVEDVFEAIETAIS